jgi:hypothetical protein
MAATWGVALMLFSTTLLIVGVLSGFVPSSIFGIRELVSLALRSLIVGGMLGAIFAVAVSRTGRHASFDTLTIGQVARWGFLGAVGIPLFLTLALGVFLPLAVIVAGSLGFGLLGAAMGVATLRIARRTPELAGGGDDRTLPPPPD